MVKGFRFSGLHVGIKEDREKSDLALIVSDHPASAAAVFTLNRVRAAPVLLSAQRVPSENVRAIVVNSGNANACTGEQGMRDAMAMTSQVAQLLDGDPHQVLVASTGVIGRLLPMDVIGAGIKGAFNELDGSDRALAAAAQAILTTDTRTKIARRSLEINHRRIELVGFAKGAAMIGPNMATMLSFLLTDARVSSAKLSQALHRAVADTFNAISVEGHTSTNDTVFFLANGASGQDIGPFEDCAFEQATLELADELATMIVDDAEGATHRIDIEVSGTASDDDARRIAQSVANSPLVKTAIAGADPNWGRVCSAAGYAGVEFEEKDMSLWLNGELLYDRGAPTKFDPAATSKILRQQRNTLVRLVFTLGNGRARWRTSDLTAEYVRLNADYTT